MLHREWRWRNDKVASTTVVVALADELRYAAFSDFGGSQKVDVSAFRISYRRQEVLRQFPRNMRADERQKVE
jgi:hypothetical protein